MVDFSLFTWKDTADRNGDLGWKPVSVLPTPLGEILVVDESKHGYTVYGLWYKGSDGIGYETLRDAQNKVEFDLLGINRWIKQEVKIPNLFQDDEPLK